MGGGDDRPPPLFPSFAAVSLRGLKGSGRSKASYVYGSYGFTATGTGSIFRGRLLSEWRTNFLRSSSCFELHPQSTRSATTMRTLCPAWLPNRARKCTSRPTLPWQSPHHRFLRKVGPSKL